MSTPARTPLLQRPLASYYLVLGPAALLIALGLVMVLSASSVTAYSQTGSSFSIFDKQLMWVCLGLPAMYLGSRLPVRAYRFLGYPLLLASLAGLALVLVPGVGPVINGATRWIQLGPFQVQPSEPAKLALALWGADLLVRKTKRLDQWRHLLVPLLPIATLLCAFVMLEPDLGTTVVVLVITLALLWVVGAPARLFGLLAAACSGLAALMIAVEPYRLARVTSFLNPAAHARDSGYQAVQGLYAIASGGWWGLGLGASRQKWAYLPNQYTDYIFAIIGEELGLVGTCVVVLLFAVLGYAGIRVARRNRDPFVRLAAAAVTAWLVGQAVVNMGAVVGLLPITGIPLPMVSFGGSALVPTLFAIGMLLSFARAEPGAAAVLAARGPGRLRRALGRIGILDPLPAAGATVTQLPRPRPSAQPVGGRRTATRGR